MTRRERLMATLKGQPVDRPAVSFYELGWWVQNPDDPDPFNVYNGPTWRPLLELANTRTDIIRSIQPGGHLAHPELWDEFVHTETRQEGFSRTTRTTIKAPGRTLTEVTRRNADIDTIWTVEHLLKDVDDLKAYLQLPPELDETIVDCSNMQALDDALGDSGIAVYDSPDPLCLAGALFPMEEYTIIALTEPALFHQLLERMAGPLFRRTQTIARDFPGRMWRIYGPEFASEPYLPPRLFEEYVVRYAGPIVKMIHEYGGFARIHCHGRMKNILPMIAGMGADALDPVEPPPQGDMELIEVRRQVGKQMVLFGNIEVADIENLSPEKFEPKVVKALREGTAGEGRGFVLMPSAAPYGRTIPPSVLANYQTMVRLAENWGG